MPSVSSLQRTANRVREKQRPDEPRDKKFHLEEEFIPEGENSCFIFCVCGGGVASLKILAQIWHFIVDKWHATFRYDSFAILLYQVLVIYR